MNGFEKPHERIFGYTDIETLTIEDDAEEVGDL